jgi:hypothetical protein
LHDFTMFMTLIKRVTNPSKSKATVIKSDGFVKVRLLERIKTAGKQGGCSSVRVLAQ